MDERPEAKPRMKRPTPEQYARRYLAYLRLAGSTKAREPLQHLDLAAEQLLLYLALAWASGKKVPVVQAMKDSPGMSTTTAHHRLKMLREQGLIALEMDEEDNRIKYVVSTALAQHHFAQMGQYLTKAST